MALDRLPDILPEEVTILIFQFGFEIMNEVTLSLSFCIQQHIFFDYLLNGDGFGNLVHKKDLNVFPIYKSIKTKSPKGQGQF
jgi:hypothetical protein